MFMSITRLCDTTNWDETYSIGAKYLRVMRSLIKMNFQLKTESKTWLLHYETIAIIVQKTLK